MGRKGETPLTLTTFRPTFRAARAGSGLTGVPLDGVSRVREKLHRPARPVTTVVINRPRFAGCQLNRCIRVSVIKLARNSDGGGAGGP